MGVSGYGTASEYLWYRDARPRAIEPDLVLLSFYPGNDVRNNSPTLEPTLPARLRRRRQPRARQRRGKAGDGRRRAAGSAAVGRLHVLPQAAC